MINLVLFTSNYEAQLKTDVQSGKLDAYKSETFDYDKSKVLPMALTIDENICDKMYCDSAHEYEDAIILYEALKDLPDVIAADQTFWVSLSHTVLFPYLKKRWGKGNLQTAVLNHWFFNNGMVRHGLGGLWWTVRLTVDEDRQDDKYRLTKVAFWNFSFRTTFMGPSIFFRVQNARTGILSYLADHPEMKVGMENKGRYICKYFNLLGATKQLAALPVEYFYQEMENNLDLMNAYDPRGKKSVEEEELDEEYIDDIIANE